MPSLFQDGTLFVNYQTTNDAVCLSEDRNEEIRTPSKCTFCLNDAEIKGRA